MPIGDEKGFAGVVDLVTMRAFTVAPGATTVTEGEVPAGMAADAADTRERLIEMCTPPTTSPAM